MPQIEKIKFLRIKIIVMQAGKVKKYVILGHSAAAISAVEAIRSHDPNGEITIVAAEKGLAYSPVLLTYYISNRLDRKGLFFTYKGFYQRNRINLLEGISAIGIDPEKQLVELSDKNKISYDRLLIATGSSARKLRFCDPDLPGLFTLKTIADADGILAHSSSKKDILILGGGLIGLQSANALAGANHKVTIVIGSSQVMSQNIDYQCSSILSKALPERKFKVLYNTSVTQLESFSDKLQATLNDGSTLSVDMVIAGKGVIPNTQMTKGSGIKTDWGIIVNQAMQSNYPNVYAAGDVAEGEDFISKEQAVVATWPNACLQGKTAGLNMSGKDIHFSSLNGNVTGIFGKAIASVGFSGKLQEGYSETKFLNPLTSVYRKLVFNEVDEIVGAVFLDAISDIGVVRNMINNRIQVPEHRRERLVRGPIRFYIP
ncbi:MAG: FAD-dependent oxidoreductase [Deltaproteobacteria bacterium]|nr:FAD-dependent oxidoreductase [Deltaproteobacteria bacterium]